MPPSSDQDAVAESAATVAFDGEGGEARLVGGATVTLRERTRVADRYEILGLIGVGGMGSVYRAHDRELDEIIALKLLRPEIADGPLVLDRFRREVKLARRVTHRNVARTFDIGEDAGSKFLTMELVDGESLGARLLREGPPPRDVALGIALDICAGLAAAHAAGVVHRDLKPDNVLLAKDGRVVLTDFGIARAFEGHGDASKTMEVSVGTPAYMAPEQVEARGEIDARADVYSLGAILFELFTGELAWPGEHPLAVAVARLAKPPPDPRLRRRDVTDAEAALVLRAMARSRDDRFASALALAHAIELLRPSPGEATARGLAPTSRTALVTADVDGHALREALAQIAPAPAKKTVAVLPFRNGGAPGDDYLADGLTDDLIDTLSMTPGLRVRARGAGQPAKGDDRDARAVGRELDVQVVVDGTVRKAAGGVQIRARIVGVADGFQLWAKRFDRPEADLFAVNDEVARAVAEALTIDGGAPLRQAPTDPVAIDLYLRGRHAFRKFWREGVLEAVALFEQALARAPDDPTILAADAVARVRLLFFGGEGSAQAAQRALVAAERAVAVAPHLGEARLALATVRLHMGDAAGAVREAKLAVQRSPSLAEAHAMLGRILVEIGRVDEGMRSLSAALAIDPGTALALQDLARAQALLGRWDEVEASFTRAVGTDIEPVQGLMRARMAAWRGDLTNAIDQVTKVDDAPGELAFLGVMKEIVAMRTFAGGGERFRKEAGTDDGGIRRRVFFYQIEAELAGMGQKDDWAIDAVARSVEAGLIDALWMERCPLITRLHGDPRMTPLRAEVQKRARAILAAFLSP